MFLLVSSGAEWEELNNIRQHHIQLGAFARKNTPSKISNLGMAISVLQASFLPRFFYTSEAALLVLIILIEIIYDLIVHLLKLAANPPNDTENLNSPLPSCGCLDFPNPSKNGDENRDITKN